VGVVLPMVGLAAHGTSPLVLPQALMGSLAVATVANVITALPDEPADRAADKRSWAVRRGGLGARRDLMWGLPLGYALGGVVLPVSDVVIRAASFALPSIVLLPALMLLPHADARERSACLRFVIICGASVTAAFLAWTLALVLGRG
jgi:4-hydroxybenzoate polyprenyltransferase